MCPVKCNPKFAEVVMNEDTACLNHIKTFQALKIFSFKIVAVKA